MQCRAALLVTAIGISSRRQQEGKNLCMSTYYRCDQAVSSLGVAELDAAGAGLHEGFDDGGVPVGGREVERRLGEAVFGDFAGRGEFANEEIDD
jgi:hypothetical protein